MSKITQYVDLPAPQPDDDLVIVDVHDTTMAPSGTTKKILVKDLLKAPSIVTKTANYTISASTDSVILCNPSANQNITLPDATTCAGQKFTIYNAQNTHSIFILTTAGQTVSGLASGAWNIGGAGSAGSCINVISDGSNWEVFAGQGVSDNFAVLGELVVNNGLVNYASFLTEGPIQTTGIYTKTSNYTINPAVDYIIKLNNATSPFNITLPDASTCFGQQFIMTCLTGNHDVTVLTTGGQTIAGLVSGAWLFGAAGQSLAVVSDGVNWQVIGACGISNQFGSIGPAFFLNGANFLGGGISTQNIATKTSNYTVTTNDYILLADTTSGNVTFTLPDATTCIGQNFTFIIVQASNSMTVNPIGGQTIGGYGVGVWQLGAYPYEGMSVFSDGSNWQISTLSGYYHNLAVNGTLNMLGNPISNIAGIVMTSGTLTTNSIKTVSSNYSVSKISDYIIKADNSLSAFSLTLPDATTCAGQNFVLIALSGNFALTIATTSSQTIGGLAASSWKLSSGPQSISVISDGANWQLLATMDIAYQINTTSDSFLGGTVHFYSGTDTSPSATASSPTFVSGTALQLNTTQDTTLYIAVQTSAALAVAIGPTSTPASTIMPSKSYALSLNTIRVPKGWWVKITGTIADLTITAVTC